MRSLSAIVNKYGSENMSNMMDDESVDIMKDVIEIYPLIVLHTFNLLPIQKTYFNVFARRFRLMSPRSKLMLFMGMAATVIFFAINMGIYP